MRKAWLVGALGAAVAVPALTLLVVRRGERIPPRPPSVPADAQWAGRGASGRFFVVEGREGTFWRVQAFEAGSGARAAATRWRLVGFARAGLGADEIAGLEGGAILLKDGSKLLPAQ